MSEDSRVHALVHNAAPAKCRIREVLGVCSITGRKHTHRIVWGGPGAEKENIGLILSVVSNVVDLQHATIQTDHCSSWLLRLEFGVIEVS